MHETAVARYSATMLDLAQLAPDTLRPITRAEFDRMVAAGIFQEDERVELLHGLLVAMSPIGPRHNETVCRLTEFLVPALQGRGRVRPQCSFAASDDSEPVPDLTVLPPGDYKDAHPTEALLAVEVADSSLGKDRTIKRDLYAACGVPEYWVVNLQDDVVEVHTDPRQGRYTSTRTQAPGTTIALVAFPDVALDVGALLA